MKCHIISYEQEGYKCIINRQQSKKCGISDVDIITIRMGVKGVMAELIITEDAPETTIGLSTRLLEELCIPLDIIYQAKCIENELHIGPVVGLLMAKENVDLIQDKMIKILEYLKDYESYHGLFYVFSWEAIDFEKGMIEGFYFNPLYNNRWKKGVFPFPTVIYRRTLLSKKQRIKLIEMTGNRMFNSYYFDKWSFWKMASQYEILCKHVPETVQFKDFENINEMLERYNSVYLKKINGSKAMGLMKVIKFKEYFFQTADMIEPLKISEKDTAFKYVESFIDNKPYIVQQGIETLSYGERPIDFRVIMQKDEHLVWKCVAIISRVGKYKGICSNSTEWGYTETFENALSNLLNANEEITQQLKEDIVEVCKMACRMLDDTGENFGDLGIDVCVDSKLHVWILEINKNHAFDIVLSLCDIDNYFTIKSNLMKYAVALTGFMIEYI